MWRCPSPACQGTGGPSTRWSWTGRRTTLPASCFPSAWRQETVTAKVNEYRAAKEKESQIKDAQAASEFYRDLYKQAGQFGLEQTYNNKLLESQADNLRKNVGISEEYIMQWLKLQQRNPPAAGTTASRGRRCPTSPRRRTPPARWKTCSPTPSRPSATWAARRWNRSSMRGVLRRMSSSPT